MTSAARSSPCSPGEAPGIFRADRRVPEARPCAAHDPSRGSRDSTSGGGSASRRYGLRASSPSGSRGHVPGDMVRRRDRALQDLTELIDGEADAQRSADQPDPMRCARVVTPVSTLRPRRGGEKPAAFVETQGVAAHASQPRQFAGTERRSGGRGVHERVSTSEHAPRSRHAPWKGASLELSVTRPVAASSPTMRAAPPRGAWPPRVEKSRHRTSAYPRSS